MPVTYNVPPQSLLQLNTLKEPSWGTAGSAASAKWMLIRQWPTVKPYRSSKIYEEIRGSLAPGWSNSILKNGGEVKIPGYLSYEDAVLINQGFYGIASTSGSGPTYPWNYSGAGASQPSLQSYAIEFNQPSFMGYATGVVFNKYVLKGTAGEWITYDLEGFAQDIDMGTAQAQTALADRAVTPVIMPQLALFIDYVGGSAIGSTAFAGTLVDFTLTLENSVSPLYTAGNLKPTQLGAKTKWKTSLEMTLAYTSALKTVVTGQIFTGTVLRIQLKATSGSNTWTQNFTGVLTEDPEMFSEKDGFQAIKIKLEGQYDSAGIGYLQNNIVNTLAAVP
jgi:hypothetical protein